MKKYYFVAFALIGVFFWRYTLQNNYIVGNQIVLGQSCPLTGPAAQLGLQMMKGATAYFSSINKQGGVHGRTISLITNDDFYEPDYARKNTIELITQQHVFAMFGEVGTPTSKAALPEIQKYHVPFLMPFTGAEFLRNPPNPLIVNLRNSYYAETQALVEYLGLTYHIEKIAVFYQNDSYGKTSLEGVKRALEKRGLKIAAEGRYRRNTLSYRNALQTIKLSEPDAVIMLGAYKPCAEFIKSAKKSGMERTVFCNISFVGSDDLIRALQGQTENVLISQVVPLPWDNKNEAAQEYREIYRAHYPDDPYGFVSFEGFLAAKLVVKALEKAGQALNRENFMEAFEQLDRKALDGFEITITPNDRQALERVFITDYHDGNFRQLEEVWVTND
ncbi:ABC transporter substrate-binding protein [uncultured Desulfobacter sp.]|uniref:ABC transporter substrate-binding protein n=1 Tax=uncultured Desulfobacter sp. TaxID=240139 RepID=UPI002AAB36D6|nr:ABC transporter substrate-binding protein [uncultured Desulfobacter sp.]